MDQDGISLQSHTVNFETSKQESNTGSISLRPASFFFGKKSTATPAVTAPDLITSPTATLASTSTSAATSTSSSTSTPILTPSTSTGGNSLKSDVNSEGITKSNLGKSHWKKEKDKDHKGKEKNNSQDKDKAISQEEYNGEPFISTTNEDKRLYDRNYLRSFEKYFTDLPESMEEIMLEFPELNNPSASGQRSSSFVATQSQKQKRKQNTTTITAPVSQSSANNTSLFVHQNNNQQLPRRSSNPYTPRPSFLKAEKDQTLREIKGLLNKLTPEKFNKLSVKLCGLFEQFDDMKAYEEAVAHIFGKAVSEPHFSKMYAELCVKLSLSHPKLDEKYAFRKALLNKCQEEFEKAIAPSQISASATFASTPTLAPITSSADPSQSSDVPWSAEEQKEKERKVKIGNVKFIGELFKFKLLSEKIIHGCLKNLFSALYKYRSDKEATEINAELLGKLLVTTGMSLESAAVASTSTSASANSDKLAAAHQQHLLDTYFTHIHKFSQDPYFSPRIRFMFQDVLDLRSNGWIPRRAENAPKKISEVHQDMLMKEFQDQYEIQQSQPSNQSQLANTTNADLVSSQTLFPSVTSNNTSSNTNSSNSSNGTNAVQQKKKKKKKPAIQGGISSTATTLTPTSISTEEQYEMAVTDAITEVFDSLEFKESCQSIKQIHTKYNYYANQNVRAERTIELMLMIYLEKNDKQRDQLFKLFNELLSQNIITEDNIVNALKRVISNLADIELDIPFASKLVAQLIAFFVAHKSLSSQSLFSITNLKTDSNLSFFKLLSDLLSPSQQ